MAGKRSEAGFALRLARLDFYVAVRIAFDLETR